VLVAGAPEGYRLLVFSDTGEVLAEALPVVGRSLEWTGERTILVHSDEEAELYIIPGTQ
jgi:hypothetical protein